MALHIERELGECISTVIERIIADAPKPPTARPKRSAKYATVVGLSEID